MCRDDFPEGENMAQKAYKELPKYFNIKKNLLFATILLLVDTADYVRKTMRN